MKSKTTAILLAFFLGGLGIHKFYLNRPGQGIAIILTLGGFFGIWPFINFIQYILMSEDDFAQKYG